VGRLRAVNLWGRTEWHSLKKILEPEKKRGLGRSWASSFASISGEKERSCVGRLEGAWTRTRRSHRLQRVGKKKAFKPLSTCCCRLVPNWGGSASAGEGHLDLEKERAREDERR